MIPVTVRTPDPVSPADSELDPHLDPHLDQRVDAFARVCEAHAGPTRRLARALLEHHRPEGPTPSEAEVDGLVALAAADLWPAVESGEVEQGVVGLHLLAAVRRAATPGARPSPVVRAVASLPSDAQWELWHVEVEHRPVASPALLREAHAALPAALVTAHEGTTQRARCLVARTQLPAYARAELDATTASRVGAHLSVCRPCAALALDLVEVRTVPGELLARVFLGAGAAAHLDSPAPTAQEPGDLARAVRRVVGGGVVAAVLGIALTLGAGALDGAGPGREAPVAEARVVTPPASGPVLTPVLDSATEVEPATTAATPDVPAGTAPSSSASTEEPAAAAPTEDPSSQPTQQPTHSPTQDPTQDPTHSPTQQPTQDPTQSQSDQPTQQQPTQQPTQQPSQQPVLARDPSAVDVAVRAAVSGIGPASVLTIGVDRLADDQRATVTVEGDAPLASVQLGPGCQLLGLGTATCEVTGSRTVTLVGAPLAPQLLDGVTGTLSTTLTGSAPRPAPTVRITVVPGGGLHDTSTADNTTSVTLGGRV